MIITVGHEKGGVGKSTLAIHLAAYLASKNRVVLVDTDEQRSSTKWGELRTHNGLPTDFTIVSQSNDPTTNIVKLSAAFDVVVVDIGAGDYTRLVEMARITDLWIAPTKVGQKEMDSTVPLIDAFTEANGRHKNGRIPLAIAINCAPAAQNSTEAALTIQAIREYAPEIVVFDNVIRDRKVFRDADREGKTIFEMPARARERAEEEFASMVAEAMKAQKNFAKEARHGN